MSEVVKKGQSSRVCSYLQISFSRVPSEGPHDLAELDAGDGSATVAVKEGEDLAILLDLVLRQQHVNVLRLHLKMQRRHRRFFWQIVNDFSIT